MNETPRDDTRPSVNMTPPEANLGNETDAVPGTKRAFQTELNGNWHLSQVSWPQFLPWDAPLDLDNGERHDPAKNRYAYSYDNVMGQGQKFYMVEAGWLPEVEV
jgi:hypothetical protein